MSVTIRDVAKAADVSLKTVSRVLNNETGVGAVTREHVLATIRELDYHPNLLARGLATNQTRNLGLIIEDVSNPFFARGINGCAVTAEKHGYNLFLASAGHDAERELKHARALLAQRVSGIILWGSGISASAIETLMESVSHRCPAVFIDRPTTSDATTWLVHRTVLEDQHRIGNLAAQHLLSEGRRNIAYIGISSRNPAGWAADQRFAGYVEALHGQGIEPRERWIGYALHATIREGLIAAATLLAQHPYPDAVFAFNDLLAIGTLQACKRANLRVPEDIAIVGVDNTELASLSEPPITSIRQHQFHTGEHAVTQLLALIGKGTAAASPTLAIESLPVPDLIVRRSSCLRLSSMLSSEDIDDLP
jgi:LacI family transcriptional regulator